MSRGKINIEQGGFQAGKSIKLQQITSNYLQAKCDEQMAQIERLQTELDELKKPKITPAMKYDCIGDFFVIIQIKCECNGFGDGENYCGNCYNEGEYPEHITIPWSTMKEIYKAMHLARVKTTIATDTDVGTLEGGVKH